MPSQPRGFLIVLTILALAACASQPAPSTVKPSFTTTGDAIFPAPSELQPQVGFWRNVYSNGWVFLVAYTNDLSVLNF